MTNGDDLFGDRFFICQLQPFALGVVKAGSGWVGMEKRIIGLEQVFKRFKHRPLDFIWELHRPVGCWCIPTPGGIGHGISHALTIQKRPGKGRPECRIPVRRAGVYKRNLTPQYAQPRHHGCQVDDLGKVGIGKFVLMQPVTHDVMGQADGGQHGLLIQVGVERDPSLIGFILTRQTAQPFTGSAASAAPAALFQLLRHHFKLEPRNVVGKVVGKTLRQGLQG